MYLVALSHGLISISPESVYVGGSEVLSLAKENGIAFAQVKEGDMVNVLDSVEAVDGVVVKPNESDVTTSRETFNRRIYTSLIHVSLGDNLYFIAYLENASSHPVTAYVKLVSIDDSGTVTNLDEAVLATADSDMMYGDIAAALVSSNTVRVFLFERDGPNASGWIAYVDVDISSNSISCGTVFTLYSIEHIRSVAATHLANGKICFAASTYESNPRLYLWLNTGTPYTTTITLSTAGSYNISLYNIPSTSLLYLTTGGKVFLFDTSGSTPVLKYSGTLPVESKMADIVYATEKSVYIIASTNQQKSAKLVSYTTNANNPFDMHTITDLSDYVDTFIYSNGTISQAPIIDDTIIYPFARASSTGSGDGGGYITFRIAENGLNVIKSELIWESNLFNGSVQALAREDGTILEIICAAYSSSANSKLSVQ